MGDCEGPGPGAVPPPGRPWGQSPPGHLRSPGRWLGEQGTRLEGTRRTRSPPRPSSSPFFKPQALPPSSRLWGPEAGSAAPLAHGVSRTRLPAHWDWQHQPGHRDLGEEERGVMYRRVCVEGDESLSPGHPEVLKSVVTGLPTPRISCTASVLTLDSYQGKAPSAPAEWSLDATPRPPTPNSGLFLTGRPVSGPAQRPSRTRAHTGGGHPRCLAPLPAAPGNSGPKCMGRVATGSKVQAVPGVMGSRKSPGPRGALSSTGTTASLCFLCCVFR